MEQFRHHWNKRVLIVDDQPEIHADFEEILKSKRMSTDRLAAAFVGEQNETVLPEFELLHAENGEEAYEMVRAARIENQPIAVAYIDVRMRAGMDGIETIRCIREFERDIEIVLMTAYTDKALPEIIQKMKLLHKLLYIRKPFTREEIQQSTLAMAGKWNIEQDLKAHRQDLTISHRRLQKVLDSICDAIALFDGAGYLLFANRLFEKLFDVTEGELRKLTPEALATRAEQRFRNRTDGTPGLASMGDNTGTLVEEVRGMMPHKRQFYRLRAPVYDDRGTACGSVVVYRDVEISRMQAESRLLRNEIVGDDDRGSVGSHVVRPLEEVERDALVHALEIFNRNVTKVAQALGIDLATLHRKMKKYALSA